MHNLAVAVESFHSAIDIALVSSGVESLACAALLAASGNRVQLRGRERQLSASLRCEQPNGSQVVQPRLLQFAPVPREADGYVRNPDVVILHARARDYTAALDAVAENVHPGQTIFIIDAPLFTAFEISRRMNKLKKRMAVNVLEVGPLFGSSWIDNGIVNVAGANSQISICGRTINETRAGLSVGRQLWNDLVPCSNVFERRLAQSARLTGAARRLFAVMGSRGEEDCAPKDESSLTGAENSIIAAMENELQQLGRLFNISVPRELPFEPLSDSLDREREELANVIRQDLVLITDLAKLARVPLPTIDSIIELASVTLGRDLRKEGRCLADLGLIGMDFREIVELINS